MNDEGKASKKNIVFLPNQTDQGFPFFPWKKQEIGPTWGRVLKTKLFPVTDHCKKNIRTNIQIEPGQLWNKRL